MAKPILTNEQVKGEHQNAYVETTSPEQVKCKLTFNRCKGSIEFEIDLSTQQDCKNAQSFAAWVSMIYQLSACD
jgi:hypothetical protein